jgi:hypothetical protein
MLTRRVCSIFLLLAFVPPLTVLQPAGASLPLLSATPHPTPTKQVTPTSGPGSIEISSDSTSINLVAAEHGGRVVWVSDQHEKYPASNLINGNKRDWGEWWTHEPPRFPQVVVFALAHDQVRTIDHVVLNPWTSEWRYGWVKDFEIYVSTTSTQLEDMGYVGSFTLDHVGIDQTFTFDPVQARYVALVVTSHWGSDEGITLNEFEVYGAPRGAVPVEPIHLKHPGNLVAASNGGHIVDYSSEDASGNYPVDNLIDGETDTQTGWSSSENLEEQQYVVFGFAGDEPHLVARVVLNPYSEQYPEDWIQEFELRGSDATSNVDEMESLGTFRLEQMGEDQSFTFGPVTLRYIALVPISNYDGTEFHLNEFEVYEPGDWTSLSPERIDWVAAVPEEEVAQEAPERLPTSPPEITTIKTDFVPHTVAASGGTPVDNIDFQVDHSDVLPVLYHLYGTYFPDLVVTTLTNRGNNLAKVRVETAIPHYTETAVETVTLGPGETVKIAQNPPLTPDALGMLRDMKQAMLHIQIDYLKEGEKRLIYEGTAPITVYSREDFPWGIPGYRTGRAFIAAMVTPNDPALDELIRVAADYHPGGTIMWGYGDETDSDGQVWNNMKAIYDAVADAYNMTYVATGLPFTSPEEEAEGLYLQRIKLPYEVLETHSGMCIELALLFASAFEKLYLDPVIIHVPGHAYVAVQIAEGSNTYYFLETTLVGRFSFEDAIQKGADEWGEDAGAVGQDRMDAYYWSNISTQRKEGVWPIPWR